MRKETKIKQVRCRLHYSVSS